ncbi:MAG: hypothetical protein Q9217_004198, partial [Psora testacea]
IEESMASDREEDASSRPQSDISDDSDTQDSDNMPRLTDSAGVRRKSNNAQGKKASTDPNREKRKKAKRAYGVRKKAKYLQDTPAEALTQELGTRGRPPVSNTHNFLSRQNMPELPGAMPRNLYAGPSPYNPYPSTGQTPIPLTPLSANPQSFGNQPTALPPNYATVPGQSSLQMQNYGSAALQGNPSSSSDPLQNDLDFAPFELSYLDDLNFENRFAAAEFGMLGTMTSGMATSPPSDGAGVFQSASDNYTPNNASRSFAQSPVDVQQYPYQQSETTTQWTKGFPQKSSKLEAGASQSAGRTIDPLDGSNKQEAPTAFAIGASAYPSPSSGSSPQGTMGGYDDSATNMNVYTNVNLQQHQAQTRQQTPSHRQPKHSATSTSVTTTPLSKDQTLPSRRHRNPSDVYNNVNQPYSYTAGFHSLTALIQGRFSPQKTARIAKALAAIRPSFISCTMRLNGDDLIFMEKCLQRTLWGLEEVISATGTPTIICRRTGEVVAAGKEFSILTGWSRDILLGKAPNLNVNKGGDASGLPGTGASSRGDNTTTPRAPEQQKPAAPVNIVSLLDDDSACDFFDDYSHLAFGDSRGAVTTPCKLLKYKTAKDIGLEDATSLDDEVASRLMQQRDANLSGKSGARSEAVMQSLGQKDGKVECMLCWTVKRDVFDIPMLFVMNAYL